MSKKKSFREEVAEQFLKALEEKPLEWYKPWRSTDTGRAINITTNKPYKGVNSFWLKHKEYNHGYGDNRWATFKQIKDKGWKLAKGSKGEKVEFYMPIDNYIEKHFPSNLNIFHSKRMCKHFSSCKNNFKCT